MDKYPDDSLKTKLPDGTERWEIQPDDVVYCRKAKHGYFVSGLRSDTLGNHDWPTAVNQPRAIFASGMPEPPHRENLPDRRNQPIAIIFYENLERIL